MSAPALAATRRQSRPAPLSPLPLSRRGCCRPTRLMTRRTLKPTAVPSIWRRHCPRVRRRGHIVREVQRAIEIAEEEAKRAAHRLDGTKFAEKLKNQPYGKAYAACARREIKRLKAFAKAAKGFLATAETFAADFQKEHQATDDSLGMLVLNRVIFGEGSKPTNHASLARGMFITGGANGQDVY